jgi:transcription termination factor Rho
MMDKQQVEQQAGKTEKRKETRFSKSRILKKFHHCLIEVLPGLQFSVEIVDVSRKGMGFLTILPESYFSGKEEIRIFPIKKRFELKAFIRNIRSHDGKTRIGVELEKSPARDEYRNYLDEILASTAK